jgi:hypothetical protein
MKSIECELPYVGSEYELSYLELNDLIYLVVSSYFIPFPKDDFLFEKGDSGRSLPYEVQNHMHSNFTTPMLYAKNHSKFQFFFCRVIKPLELYFVNF